MNSRNFLKPCQEVSWQKTKCLRIPKEVKKEKEMSKNNLRKSIFCILVISMVVAIFSFQVMAAEKAKGAAAEKMKVTGVLMKTDEGLMLDTGKKKMAVEIKAKDVAPLIGKKLKTTGTMGKDDKGNEIYKIDKYHVVEKKTASGSGSGSKK